MSAALRKKTFALMQHVPAAEHQGVGNPDSAWNWDPKVPTSRIIFSETTASQRTRTNKNGVADVGEFY